MRDVDIPPELVQDPQELGDPGKGLGRDPERSPMQWDAGPGAGFTTGTPWLPLAKDYREVNVVAQLEDPASMLALYRRLLALRRATPALETGGYAPVPSAGDLLAYLRQSAERRLLVVLNLGHQPQTFATETSGEVLLSTHLDREGERISGTIRLRADEGLIIEL